MKSANCCKNCLTPHRSGSNFCPLCGSLVKAGDEHELFVECETHPENRAIGLCVVCGKPVCSGCAVRITGKILCGDPAHTVLLQEWCQMLQLDSEFEAEALIRNLADGGIDVKSFSLHDHVAASWLNENRVLLFVRKPEEEKAKMLLKELHLIGND